MGKQKLVRFRQALVEKRAELAELRDVNSGARAPVSLDQQSVGRISRVDAMQQQAMAQAQERQRASALVAIEQALARIKSGDFGYCLQCDEEIALKRLEADPAARLCVSCAALAV
ncbi:MAG TPA: TraR/DksA family transcriptional regulator [Devosia sp.]|nr:TraR/DksA family transcriptional regulator [Devosia sp.]